MSDLSQIHTAIEQLSTKAAASSAANGEKITELTGEFAKLQADFTALAQKGFQAQSSQGNSTKDIAQLVTKSGQLEEFMSRNNRSAKAVITVPFDSLLKKNTIVGDGANERVLAPNDRMQGIVFGPERRMWLRSMIPTTPTSAASVEFTTETFVSNAGTQVNGDSSESQFEGAAKPESSVTYGLQTRQVLTIAHFLKASKQVLSDAGSLQAYLNGRLRYFLELEVERQLLLGDGVTELTDLLTTGNHVDLTGAQSDDTVIDLVHRGITQLADNDYMPSAIVMSAPGWQEVALLKDGEERYLHGMPASGGPRTLWGLPVFLTSSMPNNQFLVADFPMAVEIKSREDATVELGYVNDDFTRNLVTMLAELRMTSCVLRPSAVVVGSI